MKSFNYNGYSKARDASWKVIAENNIKELPVDVLGVAKDMGIKVMPYNNSGLLMRLMGLSKLKGRNDGLYVRFLGRKYIFYDDTVTSEGRIRFTIAHEIGHHVLDHISHGTSFIPRCAERRKDATSNAKEREANVFASRLLAPSGVLHELNVTSAEDIAKLCGMSNEAATYRANRLEKLNKRNMFSVSPLEQRAMENFKEFIKNNRIT